MSLASVNFQFPRQSEITEISRSLTPSPISLTERTSSKKKKGLKHFVLSCFGGCIGFPRLSGKRLRKLRKRWRRQASSTTLTITQEENVTEKTPVVLSNGDLHGGMIDDSDKSTSLTTRNDVRKVCDDVIFSWDKVLSDAEDPYPLTETPEHLKWYTDQPSHPRTLENGWIFCRDTSQYSYNLNGARHIRSCVINHAILGITFYQFKLESGEKFNKDVPVCKPHIANWLRGMLSMGNKLQRDAIGAHNPPTSPVEAFQILKDTYDLNQMSWLHIGLRERSDFLTSFESMLEVKTVQHGEKLGDSLIRLDPTQSQSLLFCSDETTIVFLPTKDNHILLIDAQSHTHMNAGALILQCKKSATDIDALLDDYFTYCVRPKPTGGQGDVYFISCQPRYTPCEIPL